ncbi:apolipoprotein D [Drosophila persimilis]|nr:apolipoprotein D [Drosophila persimilis]
MNLKRRIIVLVFLILLWESAKGLELYPGECPPLNPVKNFDIQKFLGVWYVQSFYPFDDEPMLECQHFLYQSHKGRLYEFELLLDNDHDKQVMTRSSVIRYHENTGGIEVKRRNSSYDNPPHKKTIPTRPHRFTMYPLALDYDSYVVMVTCNRHRRNQHYLGAWIMTRHCRPPGKFVLAAQNALIKQDIEVVNMIHANHFNCELFK